MSNLDRYSDKNGLLKPFCSWSFTGSSEALTISTQNTCWKFRKFFNAVNGTVFSGNFLVGCTSSVGPNRSLQFQTEISGNVRQRGTWTRIWRMEQKFPTRPVQPKDVVHLESWTFFSEKFMGWTEPFHSLSDRNFRKFWSNGMRPWPQPSKNPIHYTFLLIWGFSTAPCSNPGAPIHGRKRGNEFQHKAWVEFVCDAKYQLDGNRWSQCMGGVWSHPVPKCIGKLKIIIRLMTKLLPSSFYSALAVREDLTKINNCQT